MSIEAVTSTVEWGIEWGISTLEETGHVQLLATFGLRGVNTVD